MIFNRVYEYWHRYMANHQARHTLDTLVQVAECSRPTLLRILHNRTHHYDMDVMERLCSFLEIPLSELFYMDTERPHTQRPYVKKKDNSA